MKRWGKTSNRLQPPGGSKPPGGWIGKEQMTDIEPSVLTELIRQSLNQGKTAVLTVTSDSMAPLLRQGDQVFLKRAPLEQLRAGDVVTITAAADLLTHRFWGVAEENGVITLRTRGDRPLLDDPARSPADLLGRITARRRRGRELSLERGAGGWLNRHLAFLSAAEWRWLGGRLRPGKPPLPFRLIRRAIYTWACVMTAVVEQIIRFQPTPARQP